MSYRFTYNQWPFWTLLLLWLVKLVVDIFAFSTSFFNPLLLIDIIMIVIYLAVLCISFTITIDDYSVRYYIKLFYYKKQLKHLVPEQILHVKFKRVGLFRPFAIIITRKSFNVRILDFKPNSVYTHLEQFCIDHQIPYTKQPDFPNN